MAITITGYNTALQNIFSTPFDDEYNIYAAQLVSDGYTFDATHATRASIDAFKVGAPLVITGKGISYSGNNTYLTCDNFNFAAVQGTLDAAYCVIHLMIQSSPLPTDKLICCITFNGGKIESINTPILLSDCGFIGLQRETT